jgi:hypothetical protein
MRKRKLTPIRSAWLKPTLPKVLLALAMALLIVPSVTVSQPVCTQPSQLPHGDGAPIRCLVGTYSPALYGLLAAKGRYNLDYNESWNYPVNVELNYFLLVLGLVGGYAVAAGAISHLAPKRLLDDHQ